MFGGVIVGRSGGDVKGLAYLSLVHEAKRCGPRGRGRADPPPLRDNVSETAARFGTRPAQQETILPHLDGVGAPNAAALPSQRASSRRGLVVSGRREWVCFAMDWKLLVSTFAAVFLAEIGDKTQLATMSLAAGGSSRWVVFAGSALALVAASAVAVLAGEVVSRAIPPMWVKRAAGALFIVLGVVFLLSRGDAGGS